MTHAAYNDALFEEEARVAAIYPIGMIGDTENPPDWLKELWEDFVETSDPLFQSLPELKPDADDASQWALALIMHSRTGFIVKFEVCIRCYYPPPVSAFNSSWGLYRCHCVYASSIDEIGPAVLKIARDQHEAERLKAGAA